MADLGERDASAGWREPTALLPLRWGTYRGRLAGGLLLVVAGGVAIAGASPYALWLLLFGTIAHVAGWSILPAGGWRRVAAVLPSTLAMWLLLTGPRFIGVLALAYLSWLLVRSRPLASYPTLVFVLAGALMVGVSFTQYREMVLALVIEGAVLVASAFAAQFIHRSIARARHRPDRDTQDIPGEIS
jgi:hypothetical protein